MWAVWSRTSRVPSKLICDWTMSSANLSASKKRISPQIFMSPLPSQVHQDCLSILVMGKWLDG